MYVEFLVTNMITYLLPLANRVSVEESQTAV